jgi:hypothetical protein
MNGKNTAQEKEISASRKVAPFHTKVNKKRILPDVFYLRWELELLSAFVAILFLFELPDWAQMAAHLMLERYGTMVNTGWLITFLDFLIIGFAVYIFLRLMWIYLVRRQVNPARGELSYVRALDEVAELIISVCVIISVVVFLFFILQILIVFLQNEMATKVQDGIGVYSSH